MAITSESFSVREYTSKVRTTRLDECWPFDGDPIQGFLPPITIKKSPDTGFAKPGVGKAVLENAREPMVEERPRRRLGLHLRLNGCLVKKKKRAKTNNRASPQKRVRALKEITKTVPKVRSRAFEDVMQQADQINGTQVGNWGNVDQTVDLLARESKHDEKGHNVSRVRKSPRELTVPPPLIQNPLSPVYHPLSNLRGFGPVQQPNLPMQSNVCTLFAGIGPQGAGIQQHNAVGESSTHSLNPGVQLWTLNENVTPEQRTLFVTFSRGVPVTAEELYNFFSINYKDVIEAIHIPQPLYAFVVFRLPSTIAAVLNGGERTKLVIYGKEVWTRRFIPRC